MKNNNNKYHLLSDFRDITNKFNALSRAKSKQSMNSKLLVAFCSLVIAIVMVMSYRIQREAMNKIIVVDNAGEVRKVRAENEDKLYMSLLYSHCEQTGFYANSFDQNSIDENQQRSYNLCNKMDMDRIFATYESQRAYADAVNRGVCYRYEFKDILTAKRRSGNEYNVRFWGVLSIIDGINTKYVKITSNGIATRITPSWPSNPGGYNFRAYNQTYEQISQNQTEMKDSI